MAENINFIPVTELPITEADAVDVLCVENGQMKRKVGANLADEVCDMKISYNFNDNTCKIVHGTYDKVVNKIINDGYPTVYLIKLYANKKSVDIVNVEYFNELNIVTLYCGGLIFNVYPDNRIELTD